MTTPPSALQMALDGAWPVIEPRIKAALGKPEDRLLHKLVDVRDVPASTRVHLVDVGVADSGEQGLGRGRLAWTVYGATKVPLTHRRYALTLGEDVLRGVAARDAAGGDTQAAVTEWAGAVLAAEAKRLLAELMREATVLEGPPGVQSVNVARLLMQEMGSPVSAETPLSLVVRTGLLADEQATAAARRALAGGPILTVAADQWPEGILGLVLDGANLAPAVYQAVELALGWRQSVDAIDVMLDQRSSRVRFGPDAVPAGVVALLAQPPM